MMLGASDIKLCMSIYYDRDYPASYRCGPSFSSVTLSTSQPPLRQSNVLLCIRSSANGVLWQNLQTIYLLSILSVGTADRCI